MERFNIEEAGRLTPRRSADSHKGNYGHGLLIAGGMGMAGASVMAAKACLRSGIGLLTVAAPECNRTILQSSVPEAMVSVDGGNTWESVIGNPSRYTAIAAGPGIGTSAGTGDALRKLLSDSAGTPVILDADALNIIALGKDTGLLEGRIVTPHPGEFGRLLLCDGLGYDSEDRSGQASAFAICHGCTVILKGHETIVASPDGRTSVNTTGNPGMATGGSGDVLTGILLALLAQGIAPWDASRLGVFVHGLAGDLAAGCLTETAMTATDIIRFLPKAWKLIQHDNHTLS